MDDGRHWDLFPRSLDELHHLDGVMGGVEEFVVARKSKELGRALPEVVHVAVVDVFVCGVAGREGSGNRGHLKVDWIALVVKLAESHLSRCAF